MFVHKKALTTVWLLAHRYSSGQQTRRRSGSLTLSLKMRRTFGRNRFSKSRVSKQSYTMWTLLNGSQQSLGTPSMQTVSLLERQSAQWAASGLGAALQTAMSGLGIRQTCYANVIANGAVVAAIQLYSDKSLLNNKGTSVYPLKAVLLNAPFAARTDIKNMRNIAFFPEIKRPQGMSVEQYKAVKRAIHHRMLQITLEPLKRLSKSWGGVVSIPIRGEAMGAAPAVQLCWG